ncbi:MAG: outer membrane beta-barrel protein [Halothermotrichaceae bacterium]
MKKYLGFCILVFILLFSTAVYAGEFEAVGGVTSNNFDSEITFEPEILLPDEIVTVELGRLSGYGYYVGGRYIFDNNFGLGIGYDYASAPLNLYGSYEAAQASNNDVNAELDLGFESELSGPYAEVVYKLNDYITFSGALAWYDFTNTVSAGLTINDSDIIEPGDMVLFKGDGTGYLLGAELNYPVVDDWNIISNAGYRIADIDINEVNTGDFDNDNFQDIDEDVSLKMQGFKFGAGISYQF